MWRVINKYFHTLRSLKAKQLFFQLLRRLPISWTILKCINFDRRVPCPSLSRRESFDIPPVPLQDFNSLIEGKFMFINRPEEIHWPPDWNPKGVNKLWNYNLHYHDWLWSIDGCENENWSNIMLAVNDWIINYPLNHNSHGWEPYPTSLRIQNWIILLFIKHRKNLLENKKFKDDLWDSIYKQIRWLEKNLEFHLLGNHILENAAALLLAGITFNNTDGKRWKQKGIKILKHELVEQFPNKGMHFENSPMYHLRMTWLIKAISKINTDESLNFLVKYDKQSSLAVNLTRHPDGKISLLNDSAHGVYNENIVNKSEVTNGAWSLSANGYYGWRAKNNDYIICDAGELGPHYIPGHSHADCLSFEMSINGNRVISDSGLSDYEESNNRKYARSTEAHNTVEICGLSQSEMWGTFRVARKSRLINSKWIPTKNGFTLSAAHNGYRRIGARAIHKRKFEWVSGLLRITDFVSGKNKFNAISRIHFEPNISLSKFNESFVAKWEKGECRIEFKGVSKVDFKESKIFRYFGVEESRLCLECFIDIDNEAEWETIISW